MNIVIAGGSGLLGGHLFKYLSGLGHEVKVLTRSPKHKYHVFWDPSNDKIVMDQIRNTQVIVNLCGVGIGDKRWTKNRKKELLESRIAPINFLNRIKHQFDQLEHFVSISGVSCYGFDLKEDCYEESDDFGKTYIDQLVKDWESAANQFAETHPTSILRMAVVLSEKGGAIAKMLGPIKLGFGAALGKGTQIIPWIHQNDVSRSFDHIVSNRLEGTFNIVAGNITNKDLTIKIAAQSGKRIWLPPIPSFIVRLIFGRMSELLLNGVCVSNSKLVKTGFQFEHSEVDHALSDLLNKKLQ
jgi:uncharacterized protein (TIGR01777 family)